MPYLVSEFVHGVTLADQLSACRPAPREAAELIARLAEALQYAHEMGVVHRDVKPANIMLSGDGTPRLMDFGLAKRDAGDVTVTVEGQVLGTPAYMSPEQARGEGHRVDGRSDVYSLGVILYQLLTGELPFRGTARMLLHQVLHDDPRRPRSLNDHIARDLETICLKAMAKEPGRRYQTGRELADDLRRFLKGEPILARPVSAWERGVNWVKRRPAVAGLLAVSGVAVVALGVVVTSLVYNTELKGALQETEQERDKAEAATKEAKRYKYFHHIAVAHAAWRDGDVGRVEPLLDECPAEQRNWEWHYLKRLCHADLLTLPGGYTPGRGIWRVVFSPDGRRLASVSGDGFVRVWDATTGQLLRLLEGGDRGTGGWPSRRTGVAFNPDGKRLAAGMDRAVKVWDLTADEREPPLTLEGHTDRVLTVAFSPDGGRLASGSGDGTVRVWDALRGGNALWTRRGHGYVNGVAFSRNGAQLASGDSEGVVLVWDAGTGRLVHTCKDHKGHVEAVSFTPDGTRLASAGHDGLVRLWDPLTGQQLQSLAGHPGATEGAILSASFSPDGNRLACSIDDGSVRIWDVKTGLKLLTLRGHTRAALGLAFSPDGTKLVSSSGDQTIKVWDATTEPAIRLTLRGHPEGTVGAVFSPDGKRLISAGMGGQVTVWDATTGRGTPAGLSGPAGGVLCCALSPDGTLLATGSTDGHVTIRDATTGQPLFRFPGHRAEVGGVAFAPDGKRLAAGGWDQTVRVLDLTTRKQLNEFNHGDPVSGVAFSPDGTRIVSVSIHGTAKVWQATTDREPFTFQAHDSWVFGLAYSCDGNRLATTGMDQTVKVWDTTTWDQRLTLVGHNTIVRRVAFSPDRSRIVSGSFDGSVKVWDAATGQETLTLKVPPPVESVGFSPDGTQLVAAGGDGTIRIWDGRPLSAEAAGEREALGLLRCLFGKPLCKADVIDYLRTSPTISPPARDKALALVDRNREETDARNYHDAAWPVIRHPQANVFMCRFALAQMKVACERAPNNAQYRVALGIAQHRLGKFRKERYPEALATLTRCDQTQPATLAFLAMTEHQIGQKDQARITLTRLRETMKGREWAGNQEAQAFLAEAIEMIEGKPDQPKP